MKQKLKLTALIILAALAVQAAPAQALTYGEISAQSPAAGSSTFPYPSGSLVNSGGTIYFISGSTKVAFTNYAAFIGLGYSTKNVTKGNLSNYNPAQSYAITTANAEHPWSSWVSYKGTVYYVAQQGLIGVPSAAVFTVNGGSWNMVVKANKYDVAILNAAPNLTPLAANDARVSTPPNFQFSGSPALAVSQPSASAPNAPIPGTAAAGSASSTSPTTGAGSLNIPTLAASSPPAGFAIGSTNNQTAAVFNFTASGSPVTIQEIDVAISYPATLPFPPVAEVTINGISEPLVAATSTITGLNITVPNTAAGINVPVMVNYQAAGANSIPDNQPFTVNVVGVKYSSRGATLSLPVNVPSNSISLVASAPSVTLASGGQLLTDNTILFAKVTVAANAGGNLELNQLPLIISSTGGAEVVATSSNIIVADDNGGNPVQASYGTVGFAAGGSSAVTVTFNSDNTIVGNSSKTYDFYLPVQGALGAANSSSITTQLGAASGFSYTDLAGGNVSIAGAGNGITYIANYPANTVSVHN